MHVNQCLIFNQYASKDALSGDWRVLRALNALQQRRKKVQMFNRRARFARCRLSNFTNDGHFRLRVCLSPVCNLCARAAAARARASECGDQRAYDGEWH